MHHSLRPTTHGFVVGHYFVCLVCSPYAAIRLQYTSSPGAILLTDNGADRTLRAMIGRRLAMLGGALWQVARLVLIMLLILRVLPEFIPYFHVNILWAGGSSLPPALPQSFKATEN